MNGVPVTSQASARKCRQLLPRAAFRLHRQCRLAPRADRSRRERATLGFTLVELLVVVTVMLILIAMTVTAIDFTFTSERIRSGARQLQSALEGARDRAIFAREARGLRLLVDPTEPRMVTGLIYIGAARNWSEGRIYLERIDFVNNMTGATGSDGQADIVDTDGDGMPDGTSVAIVRGDAACGWSALKDRGFMGLFEDLNLNGILDPGEDSPPIGNNNGVLDLDPPRIKIPADDNGTWYTVLTNRLTPANQILQLISSYRDPGTTPPNEVMAFQGGGPSTYILELPPRILPDAQPILLPEGVVIDLDASQVPVDWRPGVPLSSMALEQQYLRPYSSHMDILFSPRGVVTGPVAATGLVHLYVAERKDVVFAVDQGVRVPPLTGTLTRRPPRFTGDVPLVPGRDQFGPDDQIDQIGQRLLLSIFTQTGKVSTHQLNTADFVNNVSGVTGRDGYADNPFLFATQGEAQSQ
jgi:prepilin-type N-terminal cleavage/methylation domain-containing protein